jgi:hypothetical protein
MLTTLHDSGVTLAALAGHCKGKICGYAAQNLEMHQNG